MNTLLLLGLALVAALAIGRLAGLIGLPRVVGYIFAGLFLGDSGLHILTSSLVDAFAPLVNFALALIGFMVGGELKYEIFRRYGRQFFIILLCEGILAMIVVTTLVWWWTGNPALAILLGALSSATAPAATVDVLWEYKSRGPLTTTILAIVALDDGLALILYGFAFAVAQALLTADSITPVGLFFGPLREILGALLLGCATGFCLDQLLPFLKKDEDRLVLNLGAILLAAGLAIKMDLSLIMVSMAIGAWLANTHRHRNEQSFESVKLFTPPIYTFFFILVGARLRLDLLPQLGVVGLLYILGRTMGKWTGAFIGGQISGAATTVRKYLGLALLSQAGVALGLSLHVYDHFSSQGAAGHALGVTVLNVIAATTFIVQILGPPAVKMAITKAGEIPVVQEATPPVSLPEN
ncbi:MAG: cation:proton antiporter [Proteobacteria bacterium]|nr:cation:proton antiporter [Pseudomonadota bacterium]MBU1688159.1 cation:proton antiporter [Pseudomonadota bacterium]